MKTAALAHDVRRGLEYGRKDDGGGAPAPTEADLKNAGAELAKINDALKKFAEQANSEMKKSGELAAETKKQVDEHLVKQAEIVGRLNDIEQKLLRRAGPAANDEAQKSTGYQLIESKEFKEFQERGDAQSRFKFACKAITSSPTSAGDLVVPDRRPGIIAPPERRMTVRDLLTPGRTGSNTIEYVRETGFTNNADVVSEGTRKPESNLVFDLLSKPVATIAHFVKASKQIIADAPMLQSYIDGRLRYGLMYKEELQLLKGSGVGINLSGIYTQASNYSAPFFVANQTYIDQLRLALLQAELAEYPATGIVLHPTDWTRIELTKTTEGAYLFANPTGIAGPVLWGRPVVATQAMTVDEFLVGAFKLGAQYFDREDANVVIATENEDDFVNNLITIRAEERIGLAVYRPEAFIKGTFEETTATP